MRKRRKIVLGLLTTSLLLAAEVSTASARRFTISEQHWTARWTSLILREPNPFAPPLRCPVTLEGSFQSRTISKVSGQLIGHVTRARVAGEKCTGGKATILGATLPWRVRYGGSFVGALPEIAKVFVQLVEASMNVEAWGFVECLFRTETNHPAIGIAERNTTTGAIPTLAAEPGATIPMLAGGCGSVSFEGVASLTVQGTTTNIIVTLVQ
jgi:hypothetical protein